MNLSNIVGAGMVSVVVIVASFALYQQNERHFAESQRWLEVCKREQEVRARHTAEQVRDDPNLPEEVRDAAQLGIQGWSEDYLYSSCFKEWHAGN
jgi:hypothetical protein